MDVLNILLNISKSIAINDNVSFNKYFDTLTNEIEDNFPDIESRGTHSMLMYLFEKNEPVLVQSDKTPPPYYGEEADNYRLQPEPVTMYEESYYLYSKPLGIYLLAERYGFTFTDENIHDITHLSEKYNRRYNEQVELKIKESKNDIRHNGKMKDYFDYYDDCHCDFWKEYLIPIFKDFDINNVKKGYFVYVNDIFSKLYANSVKVYGKPNVDGLIKCKHLKKSDYVHFSKLTIIEPYL